MKNDNNKIVANDTVPTTGRRAFVKGAAKAAAVAPAVVMLLSATTKNAQAEIDPYGTASSDG